MNRSGELETLLTALVQTWGTERMYPAFDEAISTDDGTLFIGTDPGEWWDTQAELRRIMKAQSAELQGSRAAVGHVEAYAAGNVGWGAVRLDMSFPGAPTVPMRLTTTLVREPGGWRIVQGHLSVGVANETVVGETLTV